MSSTNKTELGFNQWVKTDSPCMEDFNSDNQISEEIGQKLNQHTENKSNPHNVDCEQIGTYPKEKIDEKILKAQSYSDDNTTNLTNEIKKLVNFDLGALSSIAGLSNAGGNISILAGTGIRITPDSSNNSILITATSEAAPSLHAVEHSLGGSDVIAPDDIGASSKSIKENLTLSASSWNDNVFVYSNSNITSENTVVELYPQQGITTEQLEILQAANIIGGTQEFGSIEFLAIGDVPTIDIPVTIIIRGDL